jgi:glycosyltransferase involved in cell wall biosynthesis
MTTILHLCNYTWETGGPPSVIYGHAKIQKSHQIDQHIYATPHETQQIYPFETNQRLFVFKRSILSKILADFSWPLIFSFIRNRKKFTHINSHGLWNLGAILPYIIPNSAKKIITLHGFLDEYVLNRSAISKRIFWFIIQKYCLKKADIIHVISKNEQHFIESKFPYLANKLVYVPNGFSLPEVTCEVDSNFKIKIDEIRSNKDVVFLFLGRINKKKGLGLLIPAFQMLMKKGSLNPKLLIVGPNDGYKDELFRLMSEHHIDTDSVEVLDAVKGAEKDYLLKKCHVFILPSYSEGFSIAALEAIAYGIPGIFSDTIGFAEDIISYDAGLICELNVASLSEQMYKLSVDTTLQEQIAKNGKRLYTDKYMIEKVALSYMNEILAHK